MFVYWFQYFEFVFEVWWDDVCLVGFDVYGVGWIVQVYLVFEDVEVFLVIDWEGDVLVVDFVGLDVGVYWFGFVQCLGLVLWYVVYVMVFVRLIQDWFEVVG